MSSIEKKRWENRKKLNATDMNHENCIRVGNNESEAHARKKFEIALELIQQGMKVVTEAKVEGKDRRYDVFVLDTGNVYEIESDKSVKKKDADIIIYLEDDNE